MFEQLMGDGGLLSNTTAPKMHLMSDQGQVSVMDEAEKALGNTGAKLKQPGGQNGNGNSRVARVAEQLKEDSFDGATAILPKIEQEGAKAKGFVISLHASKRLSPELLEEFKKFGEYCDRAYKAIQAMLLHAKGKKEDFDIESYGILNAELQMKREWFLRESPFADQAKRSLIPKKSKKDKEAEAKEAQEAAQASRDAARAASASNNDKKEKDRLEEHEKCSLVTRKGVEAMFGKRAGK